MYVGTTGRPIAERAAEWKRERGYDELKVQASGLTKHQANSIEQVIKEANPGFANVNNPVSPAKKWFEKAVAWAGSYVKKHGIRTRYR